MSFWTKFRTFLPVIGINVALLLAGIVAIELAFGRWFVGYVAPDPRLLDRAFKFRQENYLPHGDVTYVRDQYGLRTSNHPISAVELVTVGGSTTAQVFISDGQTWQDVIRERSGIVVANAGADGMSAQSVDEILSDWLFQIPALRAKYYLHYVGINDAAMAQTTTIAERKKRYSWSRRIWGRSAILQAFSKLRAMLRGPHIVNHSAIKLDPQQTFQPARPLANGEAIRSYVDTFYRSNIEHLLALHRSKGQVAILVTQAGNPALVKREGGEIVVASPEYARWALLLDAINAATRSLCQAESTHCRLVDLAGELAFDQADFYDLVHNTPQGARKIGEYLAGKLGAIVERPRQL